MDENNRNMILAVVLSVVVLIGWQYFVGLPQVEKQKQAQRTEQQQQAQQPAKPAETAKPSLAPGQQPTPGTPQSAHIGPGTMTRAAALSASPRIKIETPHIQGSIALKGARIDDVSLATYHETVDPKSANIVLLSPSGSPEPFYAEFGWVNDSGGKEIGRAHV